MNGLNTFLWVAKERTVTETERKRSRGKETDPLLDLGIRRITLRPFVEVVVLT